MIPNIKEKGVIAKPTPQSSKHDPYDNNLSPKRIKELSLPSKVILISSTDPDEFNSRIKTMVEQRVRDTGMELLDIKFSTAAMPETDEFNPRVKYSALLIFRG